MNLTKLRSMLVLLLVADALPHICGRPALLSVNTSNSKQLSHVHASTVTVERLMPVEKWPLKFILQSDGTLIGLKGNTRFETGLIAKKENDDDEPWYRGNIDVLWRWAYPVRPIVYILEPRNITLPTIIEVNKEIKKLLFI